MKAQIKSELIQLILVRMIEGGIRTTDTFNRDSTSSISFDLALGHVPYFDVENNRIKFILWVELNGKTENEETDAGINANYEYEFYYEVKNLGDFFKEGELEDNSILVTLISISYSTLRGILLERINGTIFSGIILPIVNPSKLLTDHILEDEGKPKKVQVNTE